MKLNEKFSIMNDEVGVIAVREKASVEINEKNEEVKMHDFVYSFDEIIAVGVKLVDIKKNVAKVS